MLAFFLNWSASIIASYAAISSSALMSPPRVAIEGRPIDYVAEVFGCVCAQQPAELVITERDEVRKDYVRLGGSPSVSRA